MMKTVRWITYAIVFLGSASSCSEKQNNTVMICVSSTAHKYHAKRCRGVKACTHEIKKVTLAEAEDLGKTPCGFCY